MNTKTKEELSISKSYGNECLLPKDEFIKNFHIKENGLSTQDVNYLTQKYGLNEIKQAKPKKWYHYFLESLFSPFNSILLGIILVLFYTDVILPETPSYANIIVIAILIIASTLLDFFEEYRSNRAAEKLKELVATNCVVIRDGKEVEIPVKEVTLGDIVKLSAGSMIPADLRVIESKDLYVGQSALTGESDAVKKSVDTETTLEDLDSISDLDNICFMGTNVISGSAKGVVVKTGDSTYFGKIAHTISTGKPKTAFQKDIEGISKLLIRFMIIIIPIVFILNAWKHSVLTAFTFAVAIAITITPLLLPVILSSCLSKGAVRMSKKKTIVKKLDSIQNFGAMNILCTDKTGTLTEDRIVLEKYLDIYGNEDIRVLKHAFLNANFQTGLKGNIDEAIIKRGLEYNMAEITNTYKKVDEIPFDFSRRRLSVIVEDNQNKKQMITKGAVEEILSICTLADFQGKVSPLTKEVKEKVAESAIKETKNSKQIKQIEPIGEGDFWCVDSLTGQCFKSTIDDIKNAEININDRRINQGYVSLTDLMYEFGVNNGILSDDVGWRVMDGKIKLDYTSAIVIDGKPHLYIEYYPQPRPNFDSAY